MENLDELKNLEEFIVSQNKISLLSNLKCLRSLKKLNLAMNLIEVLQNTLDDLSNLEELNLSGNKICRIEEILMLKKIPNLKVLSFFDPHFGENPICKIYNYQTFMLYHFSHLEKFDNLIVNAESKKCAEIEFKKKRIYYNMKIKALKRLSITLIKLLKRASMIKKDSLDHDIQDLNHLNMLVESLKRDKIELGTNKNKRLHKVGERKYIGKVLVIEISRYFV